MATPRLSTPTVSTEVHTPPAPALGFEDSWQPYSPTRKSSRLQQRRASHRTPSPELSSRNYSSLSRDSPGSRIKKTSSRSDMTSPPPTSPKKKRMPAADNVRRVSGALTIESRVTAAAALGLPAPVDTPRKSDVRGRGTTSKSIGMLPTPAKTPSKTPTEKQRANIARISRNLFANSSDDDIMPSPKKARANDFSLDSFLAPSDDAPIAIFTDSHERIPEIDHRAGNPFYGEHAVAPTEPSLRRSKRHTVLIPGEGEVPIEEAVRRDDGMLIVFRGKKQFRKFSDMESGGPNDLIDETDAGLDGAVESRLRRPLTRSAIKPRLLFASKKSDEVDILHDDEEAPTDIEDHVMAKLQDDKEQETPETPAEMTSLPDTPKAPRFAPASPPSTKRTTRHGAKVAAESIPMKAVKAKKTSPFNQWARTKSHGSKRPAESQSPAPESAKRAKF